MLLLVGLLAAPPAWARWEGVQDDKRAAELNAMSESDLASEAFDVCIQRALTDKFFNGSEVASAPVAVQATDYLNTLAAAARRQNGGEQPPWMSQLLNAKTAKQCQRGFRSFAQITSNGKTVKPPTTPRPHHHSQLPPWLAPRQ